MKNKKLPPYAPTLIESTRAIGYSLETAVADIIDNSIAAKADTVQISYMPVGEPHICILDNGTGMSSQELDRAMQYGSQNPLEKRESEDLGRFGLGLKTASLSQCRSLTVLTKHGRSIYGRRWDIDHVIETGEWSLLVLDREEMETVPGYEELKKNKSGTLVVWEKLDRLKAGEVNFSQTLGRKMDDVRNHLSLVFHRYLSGEPGIQKLRIEMNGVSVKAADPFLEKKSTRPMDDEKIIVRGETILVRPYIIPHVSKLSQSEIKALGGKDGLRKQQGFYIYRNKRLLIWGTWFRMMAKQDLSKLARIQVDIPNTLDDLWTLDIKKSSAAPPAQIRRSLESIVKKIAEGSKRTWVHRGKKEVGDKDVHVWNRLKLRGGANYEVNREHPLVRRIIKNHPEAEKEINALLKQIEYGLPLNQIYVDLNHDEDLRNTHRQSDDEICEALRSAVDSVKEKEKKLQVLNAMAVVEPFSSHPEAVKIIMKEIDGK